MAESNQISRKRMRFSSPSATEILTLRISQNQRIATAARVHQSPSLYGKIDSKIVRTYPRVTIKDIRLRRIFSPTPISTDCECNGKGENQTKRQYHECPCDCGNSKSNVDGDNFRQTTPPDSELLSSVPIREDINGSAVKKSDTNLCSKSVLHPCSRPKIFKNTGSFSYKRLLPYLMQASDDGTSSSQCSKPLSQNPPSMSLSCNKETGETVEDLKEEVSELMTAKCQLPETTKPVLQSDRVFDKDSAGSLCGNTSPLTRVNASLPNKRAACSKRKLFKTPGSVNYRRMLPYLKDIQEDNPCVSQTVDHQKNTEEVTPSSMLISENEGTQEVVTSNVTRESDICSNKNEEPLSCERLSVFPEQSDPDKEQETQIKHVISDTENNLGSEIPLSSPLVGSRSSSEVASSALHNTFLDNLVGEGNMNGAEITEAKTSVEQLEANTSDATAELIDPSVILATPPSISPSKGILKRSMRGCRGICSCLNCSSFRLNAERAFEFSRNQLQDTEVMVLDLVGEISHLRDMLEKYKSEDHSESYKSQAGEAAKRACEAAELAKSRLHQMNDDYQVHCRIPNEQRARVKFAHYVHEKTMNLPN
ncbi:unnamed protein product [Arabidopsis lyrata]|uniref:uncharacterized protein LOC9319525 n=1 Tax=Arabidopsis lyrata subsp. lyrata TaxID=81972 RepID=UPI000A29C154|nr:uncharacterized protein LOC9319525 [Arabidopsis lyrata subsp. lyrata]CAH8261596.1 unnamed protein product [Arabidopsis lyrata]|eukprot:XP_020888504.1 uncharacterized protein LOC9319525 [Arabidopsis lyrata subsp. lyrata]